MDHANHPNEEERRKIETASLLGAMGGLTEAILRDSVKLGYEERGGCTENDVKMLGGILEWAKPMRLLRDRLNPMGWKNGTPPSLETVISPDGQRQIASAVGNWSTGFMDRMPKTALDKGPTTGNAVGGNVSQISFDPKLHPQFGNRTLDLTTTWWLLHFVDEEVGEIRLELSRATHFTRLREGSSRGHIDEFEPRLILEPIDISVPASDDDDEDDGFDVDVPVERLK